MLRSTMIMLGAGLCLIAGAASAEEAVNLMNKQPTKQELIDALKLPMKTRGIQPLTDQPQPSQRNVDLAVNFEFNSAELTLQAKNTLAIVAEALRSDDLDGQNFMIEGHTDAVGDDRYNFGLSERRAKSVWTYLVEQQNVQPSLLFAVGKGEQELLLPDRPAAAENRRVRIKSMLDE